MDSVLGIANPRTVACVNMKGGVGKTTTALSTAYAVAAAGGSALLVDLDHQMSATDFVQPSGFDLESEPLTVYDIVAVQQQSAYRAAKRRSHWSDINEVQQAGGLLDVVPGDVAFRDIHIAEQGVESLSIALAGAEEEYDLVILDCPPATGPVVQAALLAANDILMVTEAKEASLNSFIRFISFLDEMSYTFSREMNVSGILITRHRTKEIEHRRKLQLFKEHYPNALIPVRIPERAAVAKADEQHLPVAALAHSEPGAQIVAAAYAQVAKHVIEAMAETSSELSASIDKYLRRLHGSAPEVGLERTA